MNLKTLTTSLTTAALVGALGLAYAQTNRDPSAPPADGTTQRATPETTPSPMPDANAPSRTAPSDSSTMPATSSPSDSTAPRADGTMSEPAPRADRG